MLEIKRTTLPLTLPIPSVISASVSVGSVSLLLFGKRYQIDQNVSLCVLYCQVKQ